MPVSSYCGVEDLVGDQVQVAGRPSSEDIERIRAGVHLGATAIGMALPTALYVWLGTLARSIGEILSGEATPGAMGYVVALVGVVAIALITLVMHRAASRALHLHLPTLEPDDD